MTAFSGPNAQRAAAVLAASALLAVTAPSASAQGCVGRPGASALQQYCEAVPEANGSRQKPQSSGDKSGSAKSTLPSSSERVLGDSGEDGAAVAALAAGSSGGSGGSSGGASGAERSDGGATLGAGDAPAAKSDAVAPPSAPSGSALTAAKQAVETGPTAGPALAWSLLGMSVLGAAGAVFLRRRGTSLTTPPAADDA